MGFKIEEEACGAQADCRADQRAALEGTPGFRSPACEEEDFSHVRRVAVIGAGVAGLQVANLLHQVGIRCVIFERSAEVGGVWRENYADFGLQVPRQLYQFPGFPWPADGKWELFPTGAQVQEYIRRYAKEFDIYECCKLETAVLQVSPKQGASARGWSVKYQTEGLAPAVEEFDFLVMATGMYSSHPHMPVAPGIEVFKGQILHSCTFTDRKVAAGKRVVVVGGGKSAVDNAVAAAKEGKSAVLLCREAHWPVPRYLANLVPFKWGTYSRFGHSTLPMHHAEPACSRWLHWLLTPLKWLWWRIVELLFWCQFRLPREQLPKSRIEVDLFSGGQILTYEFRDMCRRGQIKYTLGAISRFHEDGVVLKDGSKLEADMVIYGTGFAKSYDIFDKSSVQPMLDLERDGLWLYRNMIPARLRDLAFIGCEVSTFNNILTHGLQALWLQHLLTGKLRLPCSGDMQAEVGRDQAWKRSWMPASSARASIWQLHMMRYHDRLVADMGERCKRKGWNVLAEVFAPYCAGDYDELFGLGAGSVTSEARALAADEEAAVKLLA
mmetsp:Transcript_30083/g.75756  ORF Transcript_30083/g.75756 Transcript_30083/m.75756 type:complete len:553 (+) Transcript_30083:57-1715(+)